MKDQSDDKKIGGVTGKGFLPGKSGNPGGMKSGTKQTFNRIKEIFATCFDEESFRKWAKTHQREYLELLVKIMPKGLEIDAQVTETAKKPDFSEELKGFTKEELRRIVLPPDPYTVIKGLSTEELVKIIKHLHNLDEIQKALRAQTN